MANFEHLKPGDKVTRLLAGMSMPMVVTKIVGDLVECAAINNNATTKDIFGEVVNGGWLFDRKTGVEEDADLGWGVKFGRTGSYLVEEK